MFFLCWFWNKLVMIRRRNQLQSKSWGPTCNIRCTWPPWLLCDYYLDYIFFWNVSSAGLRFCLTSSPVHLVVVASSCSSLFHNQNFVSPDGKLFFDNTHTQNRNSLDLKRWIPNENQSDSGEQHACCTLGTWRRVVGKTFCRVTKRPSLFWVALSKPLAVRGPASTVDDGNVALGSFFYIPSLLFHQVFDQNEGETRENEKKG